MKRELVFSLAIIVLVVPITLANVWFLKEIWNAGVLSVFTSLPELTLKGAFIIYFVKSIFGLNWSYSTSWVINKMINEHMSEVEISFYSLTGGFFGVFLTWLIVTKIIL